MELAQALTVYANLITPTNTTVMWTAVLWVLYSVTCVTTALGQEESYPLKIRRIIRTAKAGEEISPQIFPLVLAHTMFLVDGIDLVSLPFASAAFTSIDAIGKPLAHNITKGVNGTRIDNHGEMTRRALNQCLGEPDQWFQSM